MDDKILEAPKEFISSLIPLEAMFLSKSLTISPSLMKLLTERKNQKKKYEKKSVCTIFLTHKMTSNSIFKIRPL